VIDTKQEQIDVQIATDRKSSIQCIKQTINENEHVTLVTHAGLVSFIHWSENFMPTTAHAADLTNRVLFSVLCTMSQSTISVNISIESRYQLTTSEVWEGGEGGTKN